MSSVLPEGFVLVEDNDGVDVLPEVRRGVPLRGPQGEQMWVEGELPEADEVDWTAAPYFISEPVVRDERPVSGSGGSVAGVAGLPEGFVLEDSLPEGFVLEAEEPGYLGEMGARVERGARQGVQDVRAGLYGVVESVLSGPRNPYLEGQGMSLEGMREERKRLQESLEAADLEGAMLADGSPTVDPELARLRARISQIDAAMEGRTNFAENLSRAAGDLKVEARERSGEIGGEYGADRISPSRDQDFWMKVADSLGQSAPAMGGAMLNPVLGLSMMYGQAYEGAESEFVSKAQAEGRSVDLDEAARYAHAQALAQTPWEVVGDVAVAGVARKALEGGGRAIVDAMRRGDGAAAAGWLGKRLRELGGSVAGETLVTTPAQTMLDQEIAEAAGLRAELTTGEMAGRVGESMAVAAAQAGVLGGGPVALEAGARGVARVAGAGAERTTGPVVPTREAVDGVVRGRVATGAELPEGFVLVGGDATSGDSQGEDVFGRDAGGRVRLSKGGELPRLTVQHNLTEENLRFAAEMGGLAVPSLAVLPKGGAVSGFGEITLIGTRELGDPGINPVFDADAYTQRFPDPEYRKAKVREAQSMVNELKPWALKFDDSSLVGEVWDNAVNRPQPDRSIRRMEQSAAAQAAFLAEQGVNVEPVRRDAAVGEAWVMDPAFEKYRSNPALVKELSVENREGYQEFSEAARAALTAELDRRVAKMGSPRLAEKVRASTLDEYFDESGLFRFGKTLRVERALDAIGKSEVDRWATMEALKERMQGREGAFRKWIEGKVLPLHGDPMLKVKGKSVPYTLGNIVDAMTGSRVRGREKTMTFSEGQARAAMATRFRDLEEMRKAAAENILPEDEVSAQRKLTQDLLERYRDDVSRFFTGRNWKGNVDVFEAYDAAMRAISKGIRGKLSREVMERALRAEGFEGMDDAAVKLAVDAAAAFRKAPVPYFESKPQRAVGLNEFAGAVIPNNASAETRALLDEMGIPVVEYSPEDARRNRPEAINRLLERIGTDGNVVFSKSSGGGGAGQVVVPDVVQELRARWAGLPEVDVYGSAAEIPDGALRSVVEGAGASVEAFYDKVSGRVAIMRDRMGSRADVERVLRHEGLHAVFDGPLKQEYEGILLAAAKRAPEGRLQEIARDYAEAPPHVWVEEWLAYEGQTNPTGSAWRWFVYEVKRLLRRVLGDWAAEFDDGDIVAFLRKANRAVEGGRVRPIVRPSLDNDRVRYVKVMDEVGASPEKRRKFVESAKQAPGVADEVKDRIESIYAPITNAETVEVARAAINVRGVDAVLSEVMTAERPGALDYVKGIELISRLQGVGRMEEAAGLIERIAESATTQGQAIQSLSLLSKLSAEGIQVYMARLARKAVRGDKVKERLMEEIRRLRGELTKARRDAINGVLMRARKRGANVPLQRWLEERMVLNQGSIWGRYKQGVAESLANRLLPSGNVGQPAALALFTERLKGELLAKLPVGELRAAEAAGRPGLSAAEVVGEGVRNFEKYREAWVAAQREVQARLRDNPEALESLDVWLGAILDKPFSERTLAKAVREARQDLNVRMRELILENAGSQVAARKAIAAEVVRAAGLSGRDAESLAADVVALWDAEMREVRRRMLAGLAKERSRSVRKSELQRLMELNNAGALDDVELFAGVSRAMGVPAWSKALSAKVQRLQGEYEAATDPELKLAKAAQMMDAVHEALPVGWLAKVRAYANIAMLLNPKTIIRNVMGNVVLFATELTADAVVVSVVDPMVGVFTGQRTRRSLDVAERLQGMAQPVRDYWNGYEAARARGESKRESVAEGVRTLLSLAKLNARSKWDLSQLKQGDAPILRSSVGRALENSLSVVLSVPDRAFHNAAYRASISRQLKLAAARGEQLVGPTPEMVAEAMMDAARATFQDENVVSKGLRKAQEALNLGKAWGLGSVVLPFVQVPGSIVVRGAEFSPVGFVRAAYHLVAPVLARREFDQRAFTEAFSRALVGSVGMAGLGVYLMKMGIISALGDEDKDLEALRRAAGLGQYGLNVSALKRMLISGNLWTRQDAQPGDVVMGYDWLQPVAMPVAMGAQYEAVRSKQARAEAMGLQPAGGVGGAVAQAAAAGAMTLEDQPLLTGLRRLAQDIGLNGWTVGTAKQVLGVPSMMVPTVVSQVNQLLDNTVRETRGGGPLAETWAHMQSRIPVMSQQLPPKYDAFGEANVRYSYGGNSFFNVMLNPAALRVVRNSDKVLEVERIMALSGDQGVVPRRPQASVSINGVRVDLDNQQIAQYSRDVGTLWMMGYGNLAASPQYAGMSVLEKAAWMRRIVDASAEVARMRLAAGSPEIRALWVQEMQRRAQADQAAAGMQ